MEEGDGLLDELGIQKIAQVAYYGVPDIIDEIGSQKFRDAFDQRYANYGNRHDGPDIVNPVGKDIFEVDRVMEIGDYKQKDSRSRIVRREDDIENRFDQECGDPFGGSYNDHQAYRQEQAETVRPYETQQALDLSHPVSF